MTHVLIDIEKSGSLSPATLAATLELPDSIREHRVLTGFAEWVATRYPWRIALSTQVKRRLYEKAA